KSLVLESENGPGRTFIDLPAGGRVVVRGSLGSARSEARIEGFTIRGGRQGVDASLYDVVLERCVLSGNGPPSGQGVHLGTCDAQLIQCTIAGNLRPIASAGAGGLNVTGASNVLLDRSIVWGNCGPVDEIRVHAGTLEIRDCVVDNTGVQGVSGGTINYTGDNVFTDPLFCAPELCTAAPTTTGEYTLTSASPALPSNHPSGQLVGALGAQCFQQYDVDASDAPAGETEPGFVRMTDPSITGNSGNGDYFPTGTDGGITVNVLLTTGVGTGFRDRGLRPGQTTTPELLRDFVYADGASAEIRVGIPGLPAGSYLLTSYHHDWFGAGLFDIYVDDVIGTNRLVVDAASATLLEYYGESYVVESNGVDQIVIYVRPESGFEQTRFNGLTISSYDLAVDVVETAGAVTGAIRLSRGAPNPFRASTRLDYALPQPAVVDLTVFDVRGRRVATLFEGAKPAGLHSETWSGRNSQGSVAQAGIYFVRLSAQGPGGTERRTQKILRLR
ncbi:right-handed parallel beta-helix repeat-containing protein, partial [bacterium]|nr:right-handed parallel beta-helix repeat-containing protein [bacterium]